MIVGKNTHVKRCENFDPLQGGVAKTSAKSIRPFCSYMLTIIDPRIMVTIPAHCINIRCLQWKTLEIRWKQHKKLL